MRIRYLVLIATVFLASLFVVGTSFAHPPNQHAETAKTQKAKTQAAQEQRPAHDDTGTTPHRHDEKPMDEKSMADHQASGGESSEQGHEAGGHDETGGHNEAGGHDEGGDEAGGHSHWGISPDSTPFSKFMAAFGKFHPLVVHFPIALFLTAAFAQVLNMRSKDGSYDKAVTLLVWLGALGALGAGLLGWAHSGPMQAGENTVMSAHRWIGTSLLIGGLITAYLMTKARKIEGGLIGNKAFNLFLFAMALGVAINGFLGGALAHGGIKHLMPGMM